MKASSLAVVALFLVADPAGVRTWTDNTGGHKVEAEFVDFKDGNVRLRRADTGEIKSVPLDKLSEADQQFVKSRMAPGGGTATEQRQQPTVGRPPWASPEGAKARSPVVEFSWSPPPINVITPPAENAVAGRIEHESSGRGYIALTAKGVTLDLGLDVLQVAACPTGKVVYVIQRGEPVVTVVDPLTWKTVDEIAVPESPTSIWADAALIGVACNRSRVVTLIDAQNRSLVAAGTLPDRDYAPDTVIGRAPDGSIMSLWQRGSGLPDERALVHVAPDGTSRIMIKRKRTGLYWATWLPDGTGVVSQGSFTSGSDFHLAFPQGPEPFQQPNELLWLFGGTGPAFLTSDRKALVSCRIRLSPEECARSRSGYRPDESVDDRWAHVPQIPHMANRGVPWTYLIAPSFDKVLREFPGSAVVELPARQLFITVGNIQSSEQPSGGLAPVASPSPQPRGRLQASPGAFGGMGSTAPPMGMRGTLANTQPVCYYVSSIDGRVVREITLQWPSVNGRPQSAQTIGPHSRAVFIPGHELLLLPGPVDITSVGLPFGQSLQDIARAALPFGQSLHQPYQPVGGGRSIRFSYTAFRCGPVANNLVEQLPKSPVPPPREMSSEADQQFAKSRIEPRGGTAPEKREPPIAGRPPLAIPKGAKPRPRAVQFSWSPPPINVITPPAESAVAGRIERESSGRRYTALTAKGVTPDLCKDVLQVAACPTGKVVYIIRPGEPVVAVVDPLTWKIVAEIVVPESPTSIWADAALVAVACDRTRVVALIDAQTRSVVASSKVPELPEYAPETVVGRAPDGSIMSLWQRDSGEPHERALVHVAPDGTSQIMIEGASSDGRPTFGAPGNWVTWLPDGTEVLTQSFTPMPSSILNLISTQSSTESPDVDRMSQFLDKMTRLFGTDPIHVDTGPAFLTSDRKALVFRRNRVASEEWRESAQGYRPDESVDQRRANGPLVMGRPSVPWTYLISPSLDRIFREFPGSAVVELPAQQLFITVGYVGGGRSQQIVPGPPESPQPVCYYVSSADGRVVREIALAWPETDLDRRPQSIEPIGLHSGAVFVPGHELLLVPDPGPGRNVSPGGFGRIGVGGGAFGRGGLGNDRFGGPGVGRFGRPTLTPTAFPCTYTAFRCGPVANNRAQLSSGTAPVNDPPSSARVGEEIHYTPVLQPGVTPSEFRLKRTLPGMTIDPKTGALAWRPATDHVGRWLMTIFATVEGKEITLITWTLEVR